jgi:Calponin homology (CH) domain
MQNKCFTGWVSYCVAERGLAVTPTLGAAISDGLLLLSLLEVITGTPIAAPCPDPATLEQRIENHRAAVAFVASLGIDLGPQAKPEDLAKGELRAVLPLLWRLVYNCVQQGVLAPGEEAPAKAILYDFLGDASADCGVEPPQSLEDLRDGRVFASVIAKYQPEPAAAAGLSPVTTCLPPGDTENNVAKVLRYMKDEMKIPHLLDLSDFLKDLDDRSVMTFSVVLYDWSMRNAVM